MDPEAQPVAPDFTPPGGSIFDDLSGRDGPPMMRMIFIQGLIELATKAKFASFKVKLFIIVAFSAGFIAGDFRQFM